VYLQVGNSNTDNYIYWPFNVSEYTRCAIVHCT
jgi:hypothetical protein